MSKEIPEEVFDKAVDKFFEGTGFDWRTYNKAGTPRFKAAFDLIQKWARDDEAEQRAKCYQFLNGIGLQNIYGQNPYLADKGQKS